MHGRQSAADGRRRPLSLGWASSQVDAAGMGLRACVLALVVGCYAPMLAAAQVPSTIFRRVRAVDAQMLERLHDGFRRSPTFQQLVLALEDSNVIVYVTAGACDLGRIAGCLLRFVTVAGHDRYLRIVIGHVSSDERAISIVGHELQHALEVADARSVIDGASMLAMFRRTGLRECERVIGECYETQAATSVEDAILKDLGQEHYYVRR
jgi:hypothetical protein